MLSEDGLKELLEQTIRYQQFQKREAITQEKIIRILIEHVNNQQCSVQLSSQTTDNSTLPIDDVPDVSQIQSLSTPNPNSSEFVHASTSILNYLKTVPPTGASIADICKQFNQFGEKQVQQAVEYLEQDGQIYSTNDRQRYFAAHI
ncbi:unnamed protein product [Rotaria sordida]|uniref:Replication protein A C-terminal domain-containing protein n=1 Tax=Rotaria sordida TaxID=392033 RepID=A0A813P6G1_9BILA|nr:unnamed protein product [Rotaria sordida]CAF0745642.1 unnamed protein product [Rotaria sordida]CAF0851958.1 unnamed protein product [Rotaria sordida]CAF4039352.1 unnamed protein product [Rotaria sordida]